jgi:hypothetical protein
VDAGTTLLESDTNVDAALDSYERGQEQRSLTAESKTKSKGKGRKTTSLHRAIMEKLEVRKVKEELAEHSL